MFFDIHSFLKCDTLISYGIAIGYLNSILFFLSKEVTAQTEFSTVTLIIPPTYFLKLTEWELRAVTNDILIEQI